MICDIDCCGKALPVYSVKFMQSYLYVMLALCMETVMSAEMLTFLLSTQCSRFYVVIHPWPLRPAASGPCCFFIFKVWHSCTTMVRVEWWTSSPVQILLAAMQALLVWKALA